MTAASLATREMDQLDQLGTKAFDGFLVREDRVRKDLVRKDLVRHYSRH
jgi:hypothetical protein